LDFSEETKLTIGVRDGWKAMVRSSTLGSVLKYLEIPREISGAGCCSDEREIAQEEWMRIFEQMDSELIRFHQYINCIYVHSLFGGQDRGLQTRKAP